MGGDEHFFIEMRVFRIDLGTAIDQFGEVVLDLFIKLREKFLLDLAFRFEGDRKNSWIALENNLDLADTAKNVVLDRVLTRIKIFDQMVEEQFFSWELEWCGWLGHKQPP